MSKPSGTDGTTADDAAVAGLPWRPAGSACCIGGQSTACADITVDSRPGTKWPWRSCPQQRSREAASRGGLAMIGGTRESPLRATIRHRARSRRLWATVPVGVVGRLARCGTPLPGGPTGNGSGNVDGHAGSVMPGGQTWPPIDSAARSTHPEMPGLRRHREADGVPQLPGTAPPRRYRLRQPRGRPGRSAHPALRWGSTARPLSEHRSGCPTPPNPN